MRIEERKRGPPAREQNNRFFARYTFAQKKNPKRRPVFYHVIPKGAEI
jgi:hypothetical protein